MCITGDGSMLMSGQELTVAMGANGICVKTPDDLGQIDFAALLKSNKPTVLDVYIDPEEVPPMGERVRALQEDS